MVTKHLILSIDDDPHILDELDDTIRSLGYLSLKACNQVEAQEILKKRQPCLALLDLELKTDHKSAQARIQVGFNLLDEIRQKKPKDEFPIILITAHKGQNDDLGIRALRNGANDLVKKPFTTGELEGRIRHWLTECPIHGKSAPRSQKIESPMKNGSNSAKDIKTTDTLHFDGRPNQKRRNLIKINGKDVWVQTKTMEVLCKMASPLLNRKSGWLKAPQIDSGDNPHQAIKRARDDIKRFVKDPKKTIANNGNQYRLSTLPKNITWDVGLMREYFSHLIDLFPKTQNNIN